MANEAITELHCPLNPCQTASYLASVPIELWGEWGKYIECESVQAAIKECYGEEGLKKLLAGYETFKVKETVGSGIDIFIATQKQINNV